MEWYHSRRRNKEKLLLATGESKFLYSLITSNRSKVGLLVVVLVLVVLLREDEQSTGGVPSHPPLLSMHISPLRSSSISDYAAEEKQSHNSSNSGSESHHFLYLRHPFTKKPSNNKLWCLKP